MYMLIRSMVAASTAATACAMARSRMRSANTSRRSGSICLLSLRPRMGASGDRNDRFPATTAPNNDPRRPALRRRYDEFEQQPAGPFRRRPWHPTRSSGECASHLRGPGHELPCQWTKCVPGGGRLFPLSPRNNRAGATLPVRTTSMWSIMGALSGKMCSTPWPKLIFATVMVSPMPALRASTVLKNLNAPFSPSLILT